MEKLIRGQIMKYRVEVMYRTELMKKVQIPLNEIMPGSTLSARQTFEVDTKEPLTDEELRKIEACCPDWADSISVYPATTS
jgi:hypothetical protein